MKVSCKGQSLALREKKWTLKGNFVKIQDLRLKLVFFVEVSFVIMTPTSSLYVHFYFGGARSKGFAGDAQECNKVAIF